MLKNLKAIKKVAEENGNNTLVLTDRMQGEATVTVTGSGKGGRNHEFALSN